MTIRLRPHHLLCILTYQGKGYSSAFVDNYDQIVERINSGETISVVSGPDDICAPMLTSKDCHCHNESVRERDSKTLSLVEKCLRRPLIKEIDMRLTLDDIKTLRDSYQNGHFQEACSGCEWQPFCAAIARRNFTGCHFQDS